MGVSTALAARRRSPALVFVLVALAALPATGAAQTSKKPTGRAATATKEANEPSPEVERFCGVFRVASGDEIEVRCDDTGKGLVLLPLGPLLAARLAVGKTPDAAQHEALTTAAERSVNALLPMILGRGDVDPQLFAGPAAIAAVQKALLPVKARLGADPLLRSCGSDLGQRATFVQARGPQGTAWLKVQWSSGGKIAGLVESKDGPPSQMAFAVVRRDWAVTASAPATATLSVEGRNAGRTLVVEDKHGLLECVWVRDVR